MLMARLTKKCGQLRRRKLHAAPSDGLKHLLLLVHQRNSDFLEHHVVGDLFRGRRQWRSAWVSRTTTLKDQSVEETGEPNGWAVFVARRIETQKRVLRRDGLLRGTQEARRMGVVDFERVAEAAEDVIV